MWETREKASQLLTVAGPTTEDDPQLVDPRGIEDVAVFGRRVETPDAGFSWTMAAVLAHSERKTLIGFTDVARRAGK